MLRCLLTDDLPEVTLTAITRPPPHPLPHFFLLLRLPFLLLLMLPLLSILPLLLFPPPSFSPPSPPPPPPLTTCNDIQMSPV